MRRHVSKGVETSPPCCTPSMVWLTSMLAPLKSGSLAFSRLNPVFVTAIAVEFLVLEPPTAPAPARHNRPR